MTSPSSVPGIMEEEGEVVSGRREGRSGLSSPSLLDVLVLSLLFSDLLGGERGLASGECAPSPVLR